MLRTISFRFFILQLLAIRVSDGGIQSLLTFVLYTRWHFYLSRIPYGAEMN